MTRQSMSVSKLNELYYKTTHGSSVMDAANLVGVSYGQAKQGLKALKKYMGWILDGSIKDRKPIRKVCVLAAKHAIDADKISITRPEECPAPGKVIPVDAPLTGAPAIHIKFDEPTRYDILNMAFGVFSDSIQAYIEKEVRAQVGNVMRENQDLKDAMDNARIGNWAGALKTRFSQRGKEL